MNHCNVIDYNKNELTLGKTKLEMRNFIRNLPFLFLQNIRCRQENITLVTLANIPLVNECIHTLEGRYNKFCYFPGHGKLEYSLEY